MTPAGTPQWIAGPGAVVTIGLDDHGFIGVNQRVVKNTDQLADQLTARVALRGAEHLERQSHLGTPEFPLLPDLGPRSVINITMEGRHHNDRGDIKP